MLHDPRDKDVLPVADSVYLNFLAADVFIYQHRSLGGNLDGLRHVFVQFLRAGNYLHGPPPQDVGRAHQHRVTQLPGNGRGLFYIDGRLAFRLGYAQAGKQLFKFIPVLRCVNPLHGSAQDFYTACV
ncbi:MAG: hypothetical protein BWY65_02417 [Firmicutes bacterium ADurb.Bin373]|nr:MAG: hypothetical protein BWY65_02417 [Firmicutes bacterium ADurb.Bin373]